MDERFEKIILKEFNTYVTATQTLTACKVLVEASTDQDKMYHQTYISEGHKTLFEMRIPANLNE